jgi:hypothetical protein
MKVDTELNDGVNTTKESCLNLWASLGFHEARLMWQIGCSLTGWSL